MLKQTPHPVFPVLVVEGPAPEGRVSCRIGEKRAVLTREQVVKYIETREAGITRELEDPFQYGYRIPSWSRADEQLASVRELLIMGGNRSGKTEYASLKVNEVLASGEGKRVWCLQSSAASSIALQQPYVWKYLPKEWRPAQTGKLKQGAVANIGYNQKNGFSEGTFVCPNGSQCWFLNYMQDWVVFEGGECDLIWCDELVPLDLLRTLRYRLVTRGGVLLTTFTPIQGYTPTVKEYLTGAKTLLERDAKLIPYKSEDGTVTGYERVPIVQEVRNTSKPARIVYFPTEDNPFGGYKNLVEELSRAPREEILCRAYGVPTKAIAGRFPLFQDGKPHVVSQVPAEGTNYHIVDPCSGRNWFMIWVRADVRGRLFVYREWPSQKTYIEGVGYPGPWALAGRKADGERGSAQNAFGFGLRRYAEEIERCERDEKIFLRIMDSRYANSSTVGKDLVTTLLEECADAGMDFVPAPGEHIDEGVDLINDMLHWDAGAPISATNEPKLFIHESCENLIWALKEWTGADGRHGACKDPVDCLRYAVLSNLQFLEGDILKPTPSGYY